MMMMMMMRMMTMMMMMIMIIIIIIISFHYVYKVTQYQESSAQYHCIDAAVQSKFYKHFISFHFYPNWVVIQ